MQTFNGNNNNTIRLVRKKFTNTITYNVFNKYKYINIIFNKQTPKRAHCRRVLDKNHKVILNHIFVHNILYSQKTVLKLTTSLIRYKKNRMG